jgi:anti-anti-sigma factor
MKIAVRKLDSGVVLDLDGMLNQGEPANSFLAAVHGQLHSGVKNLAINMAAVPTIDSSGVGTLLRAHSVAVGSGARLIVFALTEPVKKSLVRVRLDTVIANAADEASALAGFG